MALKNQYFKNALCLMLAACLALTTISCSHSQIATKNDYRISQAQFTQEKYKRSYQSLPDKEQNGFITSFEKLWLKTLFDKPEPQKLQSLADSLEHRKVTFVSTEAKNLFFVETEEGYFPAEHEVIAFHLVLALAYAKTGDREGACVETRKTSEYLQGAYDDRRTEFDSPSLRLWLGSLWAYCGEWNHAQVDFRVASQLLGENKKLLELSEMDRPPKHLYLSLLGDGPEIQFKNNPIVSELTGRPGEVTFVVEQHKHSEIFHFENGKKMPPIATTDTNDWYKRHHQRNTAIRDTVNQSKYMMLSLGSNTQAVAHKGTALAATTAFISAGVVVGVVIIGGVIYLLANSGSTCSSGCGEFLAAVAAFGYSVMKKSYKNGSNFFKEESKKADTNHKSNMDLSDSYRFVRFLPERVSLGYSNSKEFQLEENVFNFSEEKSPVISLRSPDNETQIHIYQWTP